MSQGWRAALTILCYLGQYNINHHFQLAIANSERYQIEVNYIHGLAVRNLPLSNIPRPTLYWEGEGVICSRKLFTAHHISQPKSSNFPSFSYRQFDRRLPHHPTHRKALLLNTRLVTQEPEWWKAGGDDERTERRWEVVRATWVPDFLEKRRKVWGASVGYWTSCKVGELLEVKIARRWRE